jgi:peptide/nickel transport system substrate-binding protein
MSFDPRIGTDQASARASHLMFEGLTRVAPDGAIEPLLAGSWETPDARTYVFRLREGVFFHDGSPFGSADVVATYETFLRDDFVSAKKEKYEVIEAVEALDARTVRFRLNRPFAPFLNDAALGIVPAGSAHSAERPVGTGPFAFVSAKRDSHVLLRPHERHPNPPAQGFILKVVPDAAAREFELRKGAAHVAVNNVLASSLAAFEADAAFRVLREPGGNFSYVGFNLEDPVLSRVEVRRAVAHAIDRRAVIAGILEGLASEAASPLPPYLWAHEPALPSYEYDPAKARALLDAAGFPPGADGVRFRLLYKTSTQSEARQKAALFQEYLAAVGIALDIRAHEFAAFYEDVRKGNFQVFSLTWSGLNDPDLLHTMFHGASVPPKGANRGRYRNARVDELLDMARAELDDRVRKAYYAEVQKILAEELPYVPLWYAANTAVVSRRVEGFRLLPGGEFHALAGARLLPPGGAP